MNNNQNSLFTMINSLKKDTEKSNLQRFEALQEIEKIKGDLERQKLDEEMRRKYVYNVIDDDNNGNRGFEYIDINFPISKKGYYEDMRNKIDNNNNNKGEFKGNSRYFDADDNRAIPVFDDNVILKENVNDNNNNNNEFNINNNINNNYNNNNNETNDNINDTNDNNNNNEIETNETEIRNIYNKNMERLKNLDNIENKNYNTIESNDFTNDYINNNNNYKKYNDFNNYYTN